MGRLEHVDTAGLVVERGRAGRERVCCYQLRYTDEKVTRGTEEQTGLYARRREGSGLDEAVQSGQEGRDWCELGR